ncbi:hypothetical protein LLH03_20745 [bacterium]|nr:hypothetical protein [bacterium]
MRRFPLGALLRLLLRLSLLVPGFLLARRRAVRSFRRGLASCGVPPQVARELASAFPSFDAGWLRGLQQEVSSAGSTNLPPEAKLSATPHRKGSLRRSPPTESGEDS